MGTEPQHIQQARNELANAVAHGNTERATAARKALAAAGVDEAAEQRREAAAGKPEAHREPPRERQAPARQTTAKPAKQAATVAQRPEQSEPDDKPAKAAARKPGERLNLG